LIRAFFVRHSKDSSDCKIKRDFRIVLETAWNAYNLHISCWDALDQKASSLLAGVGVMIALLTTLKPTGSSWFSVVNIIYVLGLAFVIASGFYAFSAYGAKQASLPSTPAKTVEFYTYDGLKDPDAETAEEIVKVLNECIETNRIHIDKKTEYVNQSMKALIYGLVLIAVQAAIK
jgi:hypothetical protein